MCDRCSEGLVFFGLAEPQRMMVDGYAAALRAGWSPDNARDVSAELLADIAAGADDFLERLVTGTESVSLPDGTRVPALPFRLRWLWDGDFCGTIALRWQAGTDDLPDYTPGHIGYSVVPWKRNHGYATRALHHMLGEAREVGLKRVALTVSPDNAASKTVIERNGGRRIGSWSHPAYSHAHGHGSGVGAHGSDVQDLYVIDL